MIREARIEDCAQLVALSLEVWLSTYAKDGIDKDISEYVIETFTKDIFAQYLHDTNYLVLVFEEDKYLRGYALVNKASFYHGERRYGFEIDKLYVHSRFQGKGIGTQLLNRVRQQCGEVFWLHSWVENESISYYKQYGFRDIGRYDFKLGNELIENRVLSFSKRDES